MAKHTKGRKSIMKKLIAALAFILAVPMAHAETVNVFGGGSDDTKVIIRTTDDGETRSSIANRIGDNSWYVTDQNGNGTIVNDFSGGNDRDSE